jgi:cobalt-precorrin 5A hydrolase
MRVAGFGFRSGATRASFEAALALAGGADGLDAMATAEDKVAVAALRKLSIHLNLPLLAIRIDDIATAPTALSDNAPERYGGRRLAEAAALIAAGSGARLIGVRFISPDRKVTLAIAEGPGL